MGSASAVSCTPPCRGSWTIALKTCTSLNCFLCITRIWPCTSLSPSCFTSFLSSSDRSSSPSHSWPLPTPYPGTWGPWTQFLLARATRRTMMKYIMLLLFFELSILFLFFIFHLKCWADYLFRYLIDVFNYFEVGNWDVLEKYVPKNIIQRWSFFGVIS